LIVLIASVHLAANATHSSAKNKPTTCSHKTNEAFGLTSFSSR
jgi:hypothetical protein